MKSGGGGTKVPGGGGGAIEGGGGTNISPSKRSGTDITDPLDKRSPPTIKKKKKKGEEREQFKLNTVEQEHTLKCFMHLHTVDIQNCVRIIKYVNKLVNMQ